NDQRKVVFEQRLELMHAEDIAETVADMRHEAIQQMVARAVPERAYPEQWDAEGLAADAKRLLALDVPIADWFKEEGIAEEEIAHRLEGMSAERMAEKVETYGEKTVRMLEKNLLLQILDHLWKEHLLQLDHLRQGIHLRGYGQRDPLNEYKREAFDLFENMLQKLRETVTQVLSHLEIRLQAPASQTAAPQPAPLRTAARSALSPESRAMPAMAAESVGAGAALGGPDRPLAGDVATKVPRNAPCPCGSGRKYKHCHGNLA
ncbi:MAG: SEC-C domain-containing protein, partial [Geminicoccaceae bacterium]|nr:SEC-C domain-containing protein [Geminicoccaceae bacterium]